MKLNNKLNNIFIIILTIIIIYNLYLHLFSIKENITTLPTFTNTPLLDASGIIPNYNYKF